MTPNISSPYPIVMYPIKAFDGKGFVRLRSCTKDTVIINLGKNLIKKYNYLCFFVTALSSEASLISPGKCFIRYSLSFSCGANGDKILHMILQKQELATN